MNLEQLIVFIVLIVVLIVVLKLLFGVLFVLPAYGLSIVNTHTIGACSVYNICMSAKINGHPVTVTVDTGTDFTLIPQNYASSLGLENLPTSTILGSDIPYSGINGGATNMHSVNVLMTLEKTKPFYAGVLLNTSNNPPVILLSLHDLYQAYRLSFVPIK